MARKPNDKDIKALVKKTEEYVANELCPLLEEMGLADDPKDVRATVGATLSTTGAAVGNGVIRIKKSGGKYSTINLEFDGEEEEEEEETDDPDKLISDKTHELFDMCINLAHNKQEIHANVAAVAATILMVGRDKFGEEWFKKAILTAIVP